jgi:hypothetical protein
MTPAYPAARCCLRTLLAVRRAERWLGPRERRLPARAYSLTEGREWRWPGRLQLPRAPRFGAHGGATSCISQMSVQPNPLSASPKAAANTLA